MHTTTRQPSLRLALSAAALLAAAPAGAQITLYEHDDYQGRTYTTQGAVQNLANNGFNDRASSAVVRSGRWEICQDAAYHGNCTVLRPGQYASLSAMGLNDRVSSVRNLASNVRVADQRYAPPPVVAQDYRRRGQERLFQAPVRSARAVYGASTQRCWVEREQVSAERSDNRVPGALIGAVIGGILGHQVGGGTGRDLATVGGVVAGGVVGANVGRDHGGAAATTRNVQRCSGTPAGQGAPAYWDVTYDFRGKQHQVQLTAAPGPTISVNYAGEPRA
jgi:uncharacterized protein YcfJ